MSSVQLNFNLTGQEAKDLIVKLFQHHGVDHEQGEALDKLILEHAPKKPIKKKATKKSLSLEERIDAPYNESKCDARVWLKGGFCGQCTCSKLSGESLCKRHLDIFNKHEGKLENGFYNQERPTHHYDKTDDDSELILWHDVTDVKPRKTKKQSKPRCCGLCGQEGHTKRTCPQKDNTINNEVVAPTPERQEVDTDANSDTITFGQINQDTWTTSAGAIGQMDASEPDLVLEPEPETQPEPEPEPEDSGYDSDATVEMDTSLIQEEEPEDTSTITVELEGIFYERNDDNEVFDDEYDRVGTWDGKSIVFTSSGLKAHKFAVSQL